MSTCANRANKTIVYCPTVCWFIVVFIEILIIGLVTISSRNLTKCKMS